MKTRHILTLLALPLAGSLLAADTPPVVGNVDVTSGGALKEEKPVGEYGQPEWVKSRRFSTTRVHLQRDPWEWAAEQWWRGRFYDGGESQHRFQTELELGLPYRFQFDLYEVYQYIEGDWSHDYVSAELRWALGDWDAIPLNPTLYFEYKFTDEGADVIEPKILFGGDFGTGWHWGLNFAFEGETGGEHTQEWAVAGGISRTLIDEVLSVGLEAKYSYESVESARGDGESVFIIGPSIQWRPTPDMHLDLVGMAGMTDDSPNVEAWLVFGIDFGSEGVSRGGYKPASQRN